MESPIEAAFECYLKLCAAQGQPWPEEAHESVRDVFFSGAHSMLLATRAGFAPQAAAELDTDFELCRMLTGQMGREGS